MRVAEGLHHLLIDLHEGTRRVLDAKLLGRAAGRMVGGGGDPRLTPNLEPAGP